MINQNFLQCLQSYSSRSPQVEQLLRNAELLGVLSDVTHECTQQAINQSSFLLRGVVGIRSGDLYTAIRGLVQHLVDDAAAESISEVRQFAARHVKVQCNSSYQCNRIMQRRMAFSSTDHPLHESAGVQQLLSINLYVDNYCTKEQLRIRHSQKSLFQELKGKGLHPHFRGAQLYYRPAGMHSGHIPYTTTPSPEQHTPVTQEQAHAALPVLHATQQQEAPPMVAEQVAARPAVEQAVHHAEATAEPHQHQATTPAIPAAPAPEAPAASASPVTRLTAPAPRKEAHNQHQPLHKGVGTRSKSTHSAVNTATHRITRPPLETLRITISNTPAKLPSSSSGPKANSHSRRPTWGAHSGPYKPSTAWRIPDMLPNGTHSYR